MSTLTIKNIPYELYEGLKAVAQQNHRSINSEVIMSLKRTILPHKISVQERLADIRALRAQIPANAVTEAEITQAINAGRP